MILSMMKLLNVKFVASVDRNPKTSEVRNEDCAF